MFSDQNILITISCFNFRLFSSFCRYIQETGRAGRDGENAYCYMLMDNTSIMTHGAGQTDSSSNQTDLGHGIRQYSMSSADRVSKLQIFNFLLLVLRNSSSRSCEISTINLSEIARSTLLPFTTVETLLLLLELPPFNLIASNEKRHDLIQGRIRCSKIESKSNVVSSITDLKLKDFQRALNEIASLSGSSSNAQMRNSATLAENDTFEFSLLRLADAMGLTVSATSRLLFDMQNHGIIMYNYSNNKAKSDFEKKTESSKSGNFKDWYCDIKIDWSQIYTYCGPNCPTESSRYFSALLGVSSKFFEFVDFMNSNASRRIIDMNRLGIFIGRYSVDGQVASAIKYQAEIRFVINRYLSMTENKIMDHVDDPSSPFEVAWKTFDNVLSSIRAFPHKLFLDFLKLPQNDILGLSLDIRNFSVFDDRNSNSNRSFCLQFMNDVSVSRRDAALERFVGELTRNCSASINTNANSIGVEAMGTSADLISQFKELTGELYDAFCDNQTSAIALCITKLFHGVPFCQSIPSSSSSSSSSSDDIVEEPQSFDIRSHVCCGKYNQFEFNSLLWSVKIALLRQSGK